MRKLYSARLFTVLAAAVFFSIPLFRSTEVLSRNRVAFTASPVPADADAIFSGKCALCHGANGRGTPTWRAKGQPDFTSAKFQNSHTDAQIFNSITNGKGSFMPAWKEKLSDDERRALVRKVRSFKKGR